MLLVVSALLSLPALAGADARTVVVVPVGDGDALVPTARVARAVVQQLEGAPETRARLRYARPPLASVPADARRAKKAMDRAFDAFAMLEFDGVRKRLSRAIETFRAQVADGGSPDSYVEALHLLAATELFDGQQEAAFDAMNNAVIFDPRPPSERKYNPTVQEFHQKVLEAKERLGTLRFVVAPPALVWLNGQLYGAVEERATLRAGLYFVSIWRPGHAAWSDWVDVMAGQTRDLDVTLKRNNSTEGPLVAQLRRAATESETPPPAVAELLDKEQADAVLIVDAGEECGPTRCRIVSAMATREGWEQRRKAVFEGVALAAASQLIEGTEETPALSGITGDLAVRSCVNDSECPFEEHCRGGYCQRVVPVTRKWWFWTLIGVAAGAVAAGIAVPLAKPDAPVIEVR